MYSAACLAAVSHWFGWRISGGSSVRQRHRTAATGAQRRRSSPVNTRRPRDCWPARVSMFGLAVRGSGVRVPSAPPISRHLRAVGHHILWFALERRVPGIAETGAKLEDRFAGSRNRVRLSLQRHEHQMVGIVPARTVAVRFAGSRCFASRWFVDRCQPGAIAVDVAHLQPEQPAHMSRSDTSPVPAQVLAPLGALRSW
jgi:hypothetical protein